MRSERVQIGILLSFICLFILGAMPVVANSRPHDSSALEFAFFLSVWQLLFSLPLFLYERLTAKRVSGKVQARSSTSTKTYVVCVATGMMFGLSTWLYVLGMEKAGAVNGALAIQSYPLFAIVTEMVLLRQKKTAFELGITAALVAALYYLGTGGTWQLYGISGWFLVALAVPLLWSVAHVLIRQELVQSPITPAEVTFIRLLISVIFLASIFFISGGSPGNFLQPNLLPFALVMGLLYYLELLAWFYAMQHIDVSLASAVTTPWPVVTMVLSVLFLGTNIQTYQVWAFCLIACCIYLLLSVAVARKRPVET